MATSLINTECKRYGCMKNLLACYANCRYSGRCDDLKNEIFDKPDQAASDINAYLKERGRPPVTIQILKRGLKFADVTDAKKVISARAHGVEPEIKVKPSQGLKTGRRVKTESRKATVRIKKPRPASYLEKALALTKSKPAAKKKSEARAESKIAARRTKRTKRTAPALQPKQRKSNAMARRVKSESTESSAERESFSSLSSGGAESTVNNRSKAPRARRQKKNSGSSRARAASRNGSLYIIVEGKSANIVDEQGLMQHLMTNPSATARYFEASEVEARVQIVPKK
ncbi:MAG TPA: hypothetical protein VJZ26_10920 [Blastocatellia bacterium]|nr:hypothetical protein [Blastocatellia bacterium]